MLSLRVCLFIEKVWLKGTFTQAVYTKWTTSLPYLYLFTLPKPKPFYFKLDLKILKLTLNRPWTEPEPDLLVKIKNLTRKYKTYICFYYLKLPIIYSNYSYHQTKTYRLIYVLTYLYMFYFLIIIIIIIIILYL